MAEGRLYRKREEGSLGVMDVRDVVLRRAFDGARDGNGPEPRRVDERVTTEVMRAVLCRDLEGESIIRHTGAE